MKNTAGKRFVIGTVLALLLGGCGRPDVGWEYRSLPRSSYVSGNDYMEIAYPQAVGGAAADSINRAIETYLHSVFGIEGTADSMSLADAVDSLLRLRRSDSLYTSSTPYDLRANGRVSICGRVASVRLETYLLTGGAHGDFRVGILNFDLRDGRRIGPADLFADTVRLKALNRAAFEKMLFDRGLSGDVLLVAPDRLPLPRNIGIDSSGVTMRYDPYRVAPYAFGDMEYRIPYDEAEPLLRRIARR